ncbi:hypothetical protein EBR66_05885 [bacterium]|nr:hypothetical protein [bacterium]
MKLLLVAMLFYLLGIAIMLYIRPSYIFRKDGSWKEFGIGGEDATPFPFWMFCIVWAVVSYGIARVSVSDIKIGAIETSASDIVNSVVHPLPVEKEIGKPGYYKLDTAAMKKKGAPRYIYVGPEAPADLEE